MDNNPDTETTRDSLSVFKYYDFDIPCSSEDERSNSVNFLALWVFRVWRASINRHYEVELSNVMTLPIDMLFEIFQYLHPIDLYHLSRTSLMLYSLLSSSNTSSLWRAAYYNCCSTIPRCPPHISEIRWAELLFSPLKCEHCKMSGAFPEITTQQLICERCIQEKFTKRNELIEVPPASDVWRLVPKSQFIFADPFANFSSTKFKSYTKSDVLIMSQNFESQRLSTKEQFEAFISFNLNNVENHRKHAKLCKKWADQILKAYDREQDRRYTQLTKRIKNKFIRIGYKQQDVDSAINDGEIEEDLRKARMTRLTTSRWNKLRPKLEIPVAKAKAQRLQDERNKLIKVREGIVSQFYSQYRRDHCLAWTWSYLPPPFALYEFGPVAELINAPHTSPIPLGELAELADEMPRFINDWQASKLKELASQLPSNKGDDTQSPNLQDLDLATSVFHCLGSARSSIREGRSMIGWDGAAPHLSCRALRRYWDRRLHFNQRGFDVATTLVELVGLNPKTTIARDMDALDYRFICHNCPLEGFRGGYQGHKAYKWYECVYHWIEVETSGDHKTPSWSLLTPEATADVQRRETVDPYVFDKAWSCNHCPAHFEMQVTRTQAKEHAKLHRIDRPVENIDFVYVVDPSRTPRKMVGLAEHPLFNMKCKKCLPNKSRLYRGMRILKSHLFDAHQISGPIENVDWLQVATILRSTVTPHHDLHEPIAMHCNSTLHSE